MSKVLESLKPTLTKARNLTYFGRYAESIAEFQKIIPLLQNEIANLSDKMLIEEWNRLLTEVNNEKTMAETMIDILAGNFDNKREVRTNSANRSRVEAVNEEPVERRPRLPFGKEPFKGRAHEDDEIYNRQEKERYEREEKERREREFEERDAEIWPKKPTKPAKKSYQPQPQPKPKNRSQVGGGNNNIEGRDYSKPWLKNAKKDKPDDDKKSFLKHCYPDESGPDAELIKMLEREVVDFSPNITFDDIAELQKAKDVLEEAVLLPLAMPHLFTGIRRAWKGVLLFGPPGTGKTLLAKAIASTGKTTFFNVTSSSLASKWRGQSEKLVRILFDMAKFYAPATIFIDEIDALASKRGEKEDEANRKVKTELMTRIDGASNGSEDNKLIVVIGATNRPWDLDEAIRRRLEKRIYIPLPTEVGRRELIRINLKSEKTESVDFEEIIKRTQGYSGADIANLCREAAYMPMRRKLKKEGGLGKKLGDGKWMQEFEKEVNVPLNMEDFNEALRNVKPSVGKGDLKNYEDWMSEFGEQGTKM